jgi:hypothetical protein
MTGIVRLGINVLLIGVFLILGLGALAVVVGIVIGMFLVVSTGLFSIPLTIGELWETYPYLYGMGIGGWIGAILSFLTGMGRD